ncbi:MAG: oligoendopeptidase F [Eubacteriales bacterium]|nr:oligoendopeptidase F [Clostridiales bacterium]MDD7397643.1 oligoendopeptidase F [Eubacteriales bacterium]MDY2982614.1 oligoendopeptidase F [Eubacteriales bacterium]
MKRSEMDPRFQWDFTHIYPDKAHWEAAMTEAEKAVEALSALHGTLGQSKDALKKGLEQLADASQKVEIPYIYAMLHRAADGSEPAYQEMEARGMSLAVKANAATSFLDPEILAIPKEQLDAWMAQEDMAVYRHMVEDISRGRAHTLSADKEKMLAMLGEAADTPSSAYEMLTNVNMVFPKIHNEAGEEVQLTSGNFGVYRESRSRAVREEAFRAMFGTYRKYGDTFAALYGGQIKFDTFFANVRGYGSSIEAYLDGGNVPVSVYDSLIEAVHESLPAMKEYLALRKKALKLDKLDIFDLYVPMVEDVDYPVPFENVKELVKNATKPLGEEYQQLLDRAFAENWMDVYENQGKRGGAFSCGVYGVHPYVLLNYTDTLDDAFTVAHELGHSMHSFFSSRAQEFVNHSYRIMVAEVASTVNEVLMTMYLLKTETDKKRRAYILNHFLEGFRTTLFRQTLFAEFERKAHELHAAGTPLTSQTLNKIYHDLVALYYEGAEIDEEIDTEWSFIPHFYTPFYVYQYATGFSSAVAIARHILETGDASEYLRFLSTGGSDYPLNELKIAGIDLTKPDTVKSALEVFANTVKEFEALL